MRRVSKKQLTLNLSTELAGLGILQLLNLCVMYVYGSGLYVKLVSLAIVILAVISYLKYRKRLRDIIREKGDNQW